MYDNICKFIAENFKDDISTWLLGKPLELTKLSPTELSLEPIRADSLILQESEKLVLHIEFQTQIDKEIPFRMTDYRLRVYRRFPQKEMRQIIIYLTPTNSPLVHQNYFKLKNTYHEFEIIRLWEQPTEIFFKSQGLLPFAVLSKSDNPLEILTQVAQEIDKIDQKRIRSNLTAASSILAGLQLKQELIQQILRRDMMRESVIYQEILNEGKLEGKLEVALNLLRENITIEEVKRFTGLSIELLENFQKEMNIQN